MYYSTNFGRFANMDLEHIKALLAQRHMTFEDLAQKMGKERSVVYKTISNGNPTLNFLVKLSEALNLSIDEIVSSPKHESKAINNDEIIDGFVEIDGTTHRIRSKKDIEKIYKSLYNIR